MEKLLSGNPTRPASRLIEGGDPPYPLYVRNHPKEPIIEQPMPLINFQESSQQPKRRSAIVTQPIHSKNDDEKKGEVNKLSVFQQPPDIMGLAAYQSDSEYALPSPPPMPPPTNIPPGTVPGLEFLIPLYRIFVKQKIEILDVDADVFTGNKYDVLNGVGQRLYMAAEESAVALRHGTSAREFTITISDFSGPVLILNRSYEQYTCGGGGVMVVTLPSGTCLGKVVRTNSCSSHFAITDSNNKTIMKISGTSAGDCCSGNVDYPIIRTDGIPVGVIRKTFVGYITEHLSFANNFGVEFKKDLDVNWKAMMLASTFLINFLYFPRRADMRIYVQNG